jgi:predicted neutral ceramidase superfamily lipid hydrolase
MAQKKEKQKKLLTEIMEADAKDGLYKQQTAVEWLIDQLNKNENIRWSGAHVSELTEQAKALEKEQIKASFKFGVHEGFLTDINYLRCDKDAEYYYNQTYNK